MYIMLVHVPHTFHLQDILFVSMCILLHLHRLYFPCSLCTRTEMALYPSGRKRLCDRCLYDEDLVLNLKLYVAVYINLYVFLLISVQQVSDHRYFAYIMYL